MHPNYLACKLPALSAPAIDVNPSFPKTQNLNACQHAAMSMSELTDKVQQMGLSVPKTAFYLNADSSVAQPKAFVVQLVPTRNRR